MTNCCSVLQEHMSSYTLATYLFFHSPQLVKCVGFIWMTNPPPDHLSKHKSGSHVRRLTQDKKIMGTPPFEELFTYELPGTLSQSV